MKNQKTNIIASYTTDWDETITIFEVDGQIYQRDEDGEVEAVEFNDHDANTDGKLNRENVSVIGWEVDENTGRTLNAFELFYDEMEQKYGEEAADALCEFFSEELEAADKENRDYLTPLEKDWILEKYSDFCEENADDYEDNEAGKRERKIDFVNEFQDKLTFHDSDEMIKIIDEIEAEAMRD